MENRRTVYHEYSSRCPRRGPGRVKAHGAFWSKKVDILNYKEISVTFQLRKTADIFRLLTLAQLLGCPHTVDKISALHWLFLRYGESVYRLLRERGL
jgi:hypothetical protein